MAKAKGTRQLKRRILFMFAAFIIVIGAMIGRTGYLQIVKGEWLQKEAIDQQTQDRQIRSKRGAIVDRNGKALAVSASVEQVSVSPNVIKEEGNADEVVGALSEILKLDPETVRKKVTADSYYMSIQRRVEKDVADQIRAKKLKGVNLDEDTKRYYPYGNFASHVIGFTGDDNQGLNGLEKEFDEELRGLPGRVVSASNAKGTDVPYKFEQYIDPKDGYNVVLAIDEVIQHFVEKYLEKARIESGLAKGAAAIVMDPKTGEILAMASKPDFDLNAPFTLNDQSIEQSLAGLPAEEYNTKKSEALLQMWRNKAVTDSYEPGSTFKLATSAMALEQGVVDMNTTFVCNGSYRVADRTIKCWDQAHGGHGVQTFPKAVCNSCNPAFIQIGERVGTEAFYKYVKAFGFRDTTGIELPGEANGVFFGEKDFNTIQLATSSFGQGFQITPLQMITYVSAIANGGTLYKPHLVKQLTDSDGNVVKSYDPEPVRRIMSEQTANTLCGIMELVVNEGGGSNAYIKGYRVGGKTGTSEKLPRGNGKYVASFVGIAPADDPQLVCLIMMDEPTGVYYGGTIAAPVGRAILDDALHYLNVEPQYTGEEQATPEVLVPDVTDNTVANAKTAVINANLNYKVIGEGEKVETQIPMGHATIPEGSTVILYTTGAEEQKVTVPDLADKTAAQAKLALTEVGLNFSFSDIAPNAANASTVLSQSPAAGSEVPIGTIVTVDFRMLSTD